MCVCVFFMLNCYTFIGQPGLQCLSGLQDSSHITQPHMQGIAAEHSIFLQLGEERRYKLVVFNILFTRSVDSGWLVSVQVISSPVSAGGRRGHVPLLAQTELK